MTWVCVSVDLQQMVSLRFHKDRLPVAWGIRFFEVEDDHENSSERF